MAPMARSLIARDGRRILRRALHIDVNGPARLEPSEKIRRASPLISSILSSFGDVEPGGGIDEAAPLPADFFERRRQRSRTAEEEDEDSAAVESTKKSLEKSSSISEVEMRQWRTPHMPILTPRQLETSLIEIKRRERGRRRRGTRRTGITGSADEVPEVEDPHVRKREAAVLVPLCTIEGAPSILFTRRSPDLSSHASQISFPGGYRDEALDDEIVSAVEGGDGLVNAALREMREELRYDAAGLGEGGCAGNLPFVSVLGRTQPVPSMNGSRVTPVIGTINYDLPHHASPKFSRLFPGNPDEVDWIFTIPICDLIKTEKAEPLMRPGTNTDDESNAQMRSRNKIWGPVFPVPECDEKHEGDRIWGLTAIVLRPLLSRVFQPVFEGMISDSDRTAGEERVTGTRARS